MARSRPGRARSRARGAVRARGAGRARGRQPHGKAYVGSLFATLLLLVMLVVFLVNRAAIRDVMERTELVDVLQRRMDSAVGRGQPPPLPPVRTTPAAGPVAAPDPVPAPPSERPAGTAPAAPPLPDPAPDSPRAPAAPQTPVMDAVPERAPESAAPAPAAPAADRRPERARGAFRAEEKAPAAAPAPRPKRQHRLYFAAVDPSGGISVTGVTRTANATAAPLTEMLITLLAGPDKTESTRGLTTLIPPAVTLNRVYVRERVAYVDVSESFRFNRLGREGLDIQLQQVVYSATQFANVEQVQILIDGRRVDYLASEGTFVGEPIGREAFQ